MCSCNLSCESLQGFTKWIKLATWEIHGFQLIKIEFKNSKVLQVRLPYLSYNLVTYYINFILSSLLTFINAVPSKPCLLFKFMDYRAIDYSKILYTSHLYTLSYSYFYLVQSIRSNLFNVSVLSPLNDHVVR